MRELAETVERLRRDGHLNDAQAAFFSRVARGEVLSVRVELQAALYVGVLLAATGAGILVKEHYRDLGPLGIALGIGAAAAFCLGYAFRVSPRFSRKAVPSPTLAFDYLLLLGVLLIGSELAWLETHFALLGPSWPHHLLVVSLVCLAVAHRFDSRAVLSLALTSFAAWRGVALSLEMASGPDPERLRLNALGCGLLFLAGGWAARRFDVKAHFLGVWGNIGLLFLLGGLLSGVLRPGPESAAWALPLFLTCCASMWLAWRLRRPDWFALGVVAGYLGFLRFLLEWFPGSVGVLLLALSSLGVLLFILRARKSMREDAP